VFFTIIEINRPAPKKMIEYRYARIKYRAIRDISNNVISSPMNMIRVPMDNAIDTAITRNKDIMAPSIFPVIILSL
jgi:hypothetical protein